MSTRPPDVTPPVPIRALAGFDVPTFDAESSICNAACPSERIWSCAFFAMIIDNWFAVSAWLAMDETFMSRPSAAAEPHFSPLAASTPLQASTPAKRSHPPNNRPRFPPPPRTRRSARPRFRAPAGDSRALAPRPQSGSMKAGSEKGFTSRRDDEHIPENGGV